MGFVFTSAGLGTIGGVTIGLGTALAAALLPLAALTGIVVVNRFKAAAGNARDDIDPEIAKLRQARQVFRDSVGSPAHLTTVRDDLIAARANLQRDPTP